MTFKSNTTERTNCSFVQSEKYSKTFFFPRGKIQIPSSLKPQTQLEALGPGAPYLFASVSVARARTNGSPMSSTAARAVPPAAAASPPLPRRLRPARCTAGAAAAETATAGPTRVATVSNRGGSLAICRVLNGMWQTSGGWGRIDRDAAVDAMLAYADAGLSTFDMADHCTCSYPSPCPTNISAPSMARHSHEYLACMRLVFFATVKCYYI